MKFRMFLFYMAVICFAGTGTLFASGQAEPGDDVEIVWQSWITPNLTAEFYDNAIEKFESANPGIRIKRIQPPANTGNADNYLKSLLQTGDFPDIVQNHTAKLFVEAEQLWAIPKDWSGLKSIKGWETAMIGNELYNINPNAQPKSLIFYNKNIFKEAGIENLPRTWDEFEAVCEKVKASGHTPILTGGEWVSGFVASLFAQHQVFSGNTDWYADRWDDTVKFTDPDYIEATAYFGKLVDKGYFNEQAVSVSYPELEQMFLQGKGAMYPMGSWFTAAESQADKDFEVGVFSVPTKDGSPFMLGGANLGGFSISANSEHKEEALEFIRFMTMDPEVGTQFIESDGLYSTLEPALTYNMSPLQQEVVNLLDKCPPLVGYANNKAGRYPVDGIFDILITIGQEQLMGNNSDIEGLLQRVDDYWAKTAR